VIILNTVYTTFWRYIRKNKICPYNQDEW